MQSGMEMFLQCKEASPNFMGLLRNMMRLLGNIAEVNLAMTGSYDEISCYIILRVKRKE